MCTLLKFGGVIEKGRGEQIIGLYKAFWNKIVYGAWV